MAWADTVTIHQLLNHTSGYQGRDKALAFLPGSRFSYSNQAYGLLGDILSKVRGKSYEELAEKLFRSCGMKHTTTPSLYKGKALPVGFSKQPDGKIAAESETYRGIPVPAGLILSTPADLVRWNALLHEQQKLLTLRSYQAMTAPSSRRPHPIFGDVDYGYGLQFTNVDGIREISHGGYAPGFVAVNFYYPGTQTSLIVMENLDWKDPAFKESYHFEMEIRKILRKAIR
jgi:CubicO group peptidase (beta-lactamase class C family)